MIQVLPPKLANQIAAGEVVERPASVVKELTENAIDAGATAISVEIENGGIDSICVVDNGTGIRAEELEIAFLRHATSKIASTSDLFCIDTLGFRGEALASIASVSNVTMTSCHVDEELGARIRFEDGKLVDKCSIGCAKGSSVEVRGLFMNVPARLKFLKLPRTEASYIADYLSRMMMARPDIAFTFRNNGKLVYQTFGDNKLINTLLSIYGTGVLPHLGQVNYDDGYIKIEGYIGDADLSKQNRSHQSFFLNGRYIRSYALSGALNTAFDTRLMIGRFAFAVLQLTMAPTDIDVNVHPTKMEVRFTDEARVVRALTVACTTALKKAVATPSPIQTEQLMTEQTKASKEDGTPKPPLPQRYPLHVSEHYDETAHENKPLVNLRTPIVNPTNRVREAAPSAAQLQTTGSVAGIQRYTIPSRKETVPLQTRPIVMEQPKLVSDPYTVIGCLFDAYWIVQQGNDIFYIDQHAAHERRLYDRLLAREESIVSQSLLTPRYILLDAIDYETLTANLDALIQLGYLLKPLESYRCEVKAVPQLRGEALQDRFLFDALHQLRQLGETSDKQLLRSTLMQTACKHAIKAGEKIDRAQIEELIAYFQRDGAPLTCPHGRPVMIRMTKMDIEKLFKRVI